VGCFRRAGILEIFEVECHVTGVVVDLFEIALDDGVFIGIDGRAKSGEGSGQSEIGTKKMLRIDRIIQVDCFAEIVL
jgi:hypothetical protein